MDVIEQEAGEVDDDDEGDRMDVDKSPPQPSAPSHLPHQVDGEAMEVDEPPQQPSAPSHLLGGGQVGPTFSSWRSVGQ